MPGTLNHKGGAEGGESYLVTMEDFTGSDIAPWSPEALRDRLGPAPPRSGAAGQPAPNKGQRGKSAGRRASTFAAVASEPILEGLPDWVMALVHFSSEGNPRGDQSNSGQLYRLVATLIEEGLTDGQVMGLALYSEPGQEKFPEENNLRREIQRIIDKVRPHHQHPGFACAESACDFESHPDASRRAEAVRQHFDLNRRTSTTVNSESKVLEALLRRATLLGDLELDMSRRELCRLAGLGSRNTADRALERLTEAGYVEKILLKNGNPLRKGNGDPATRAYRYRLVVPDVRVEPHSNSRMYDTPQNKKMWTCGSTLTLDPSHDIWRFGGLATVRLTYRALCLGFSTVKEIAEDLEKSVRTINRHLDRLAQYGLAEQKPDGTSWIPLDRDADELADELGTSGLGEAQAGYHAWESEKFKIHLNLRDLVRENSSGE